MNDSFVGERLNFRGLTYAPVNEQGVILLFGMICEDLNIIIEEIKSGFPDCICRINTKNGWKRVSVEFEFNSSNFKAHNHDEKLCDFIVCWGHDWIDYPKGVIDIICLKDEVAKIIKLEQELEDKKSTGGEIAFTDEERDLREYFNRKNTPSLIREFVHKIDLLIKKIDVNIWLKVVVKSLNYYGRVENSNRDQIFCVLIPQQKALKLIYIKEDDWNELRITDIEQLDKAITRIKKSFEIICKKE